MPRLVELGYLICIWEPSGSTTQTLQPLKTIKVDSCFSVQLINLIVEHPSFVKLVVLSTSEMSCWCSQVLGYISALFCLLVVCVFFWRGCFLCMWFGVVGWLFLFGWLYFVCLFGFVCLSPPPVCYIWFHVPWWIVFQMWGRRLEKKKKKACGRTVSIKEYGRKGN